MDLLPFIRSLGAAPDPAPASDLLRLALRHHSSALTESLDEDLVRAGGMLGHADPAIRHFLFTTLYPVWLEADAPPDPVLSGAVLFAATQVAARRLVPSGRQIFVQIGRGGEEAFAAAAAANPFLPSFLHILTDDVPPPPAKAANWPGLLGRLTGCTASPASPPLPSPMRSPEALDMQPRLRKAPLRDRLDRWTSEFHQVARVAAGTEPVLPEETRLGVCVLNGLDGAAAYETLLRRLAERFTDTSAAILALPAGEAEALAHYLRTAFPRLDDGGWTKWVARHDYVHAGKPRTLLCVSGEAFDPPPPPAVRTLSGHHPEPRDYASIVTKSDSAFAGENLEITPAVRLTALPPLFLDPPDSVPAGYRDHLAARELDERPVTFSRLPGGAIFAGSTRYELLKHNFCDIDPSNFGKPAMFPVYALDGAGNVVRPNCHSFDWPQYEVDRRDGGKQLVMSVQRRRHVSGDAVMVFDSEANSHWLFEGFFPLYALERLGIQPTVLVRGNLPDYQFEMLTGLGIPKDRIIRLLPGDFVTCDTLYVYDVEFTINPEMAAFTERFADRFVPPAPDEGIGERIYVARTDSRVHRRFLNENAVVEAALDLGYRLVVPSQLDVRGLITTFRRARVIAGALGAGLLNSIYSRPGARLLVMTAELYYETHLKRLCAVKGHRLGWSFGPPFRCDDVVFRGFCSDWVIDVDRVTDELHRLAKDDAP